MITALLGPGKYSFSVDRIGNRVLSAGENVDLFVPQIDRDMQGALFTRLDKERFRVGVEICFCSTLGECWTLVAPAMQPAKTVDSPRCPAPSAQTFQQ